MLAHAMTALPDHPSEATRPRVTLVMTVRERHRLTMRAIENVLAHTPIPHRFIFSHGELPGWLDRQVGELAEAGRLERRFFPGLTWPNHLRRAVLPEIETDYVAFIDNDILVSPGWIERLIECADETGAGVVGPTYLWGDGEAPPRVHMAGGILRETAVSGGKVMEEIHRHMDADPGAVREALKRSPCDFVEYHCLMMRTAIAREPGVIDPDIVAVLEHIDASLEAKKRGGPTYLEPTAEVTYMAFAPHVLDDLGLMRHRWGEPAVESSIAAFSRKWNVVPDGRSYGGVRKYVHEMRWRHDPLRRLAAHGDLGEPMAAAQLCQTRSALIDLAHARGYVPAERAILAKACGLAIALMDGGYRPCGRPFINHLIGTAGVLIRYDLSVETVCEGMLHAAYTHRRIPTEKVRELLATLHPKVEARVRDYTLRNQAGAEAAKSPAMSSPREAEVAAIRAANEIDMRLSGEYDHSGRKAELSAPKVEHLAAVLEMIGVAGMAQSLRDCVGRRREVPPELVTGLAVSYRFGPGNTLVPMVSPR